ncbi:DinB family protein [Flavobacterium sp.]|uniref:DinB family protein n=1 Tax=Flavobacterium sp. TaxID=239 RepID=UPI0039E5D181
MSTTATTQMPFTLVSLAKSYADYNAWANKKLVDFLQTKPTALLDTEVPSSFPTIRLTLIHILEVQDFWFGVMKGTHNEPKVELPGTVDGLLKIMIRNSEQLANYTASLSEAELQQNCYLKTQWFEADKTRLEYLMHTMNHSTYHRGQIITMGRALGFTDAPMTDYNYYILMG